MEVSSGPCLCSVRRASRSSLNLRSSLPDEVNCSFTENVAYGFYQTNNIKVEVGKLLGSGGFGAVFEGKCMGRKIALKKLHRNSKNPHAIAESFEAEKVVKALRHRNVVRIIATTEASHELKSEKLVLMEYAGQKNLLNIINDEKESIHDNRRIKFATDIANALCYIHNLNIAHLDVKPANIMVTIADTCKLGDFGCCKVLSESGATSPTTPTNSYLTGTLAYRSPELLKGDYPTCKADMYSYGICLWQLLTRCRPYGAENLYVVIFGVVAYNLRPEVSEDMRAGHAPYVRLIEDLWLADPDRRPAATQALTRLRSMRTRKTSQPTTATTMARWRL